MNPIAPSQDYDDHELDSDLNTSRVPVCKGCRKRLHHEEVCWCIPTPKSHLDALQAMSEGRVVAVPK